MMAHHEQKERDRFHLETTGRSDIRRVVHRTRVVGLAMKYTNGMWRAHSANDDVLSPKWFCTAAAVRKWFEQNPDATANQLAKKG